MALTETDVRNVMNAGVSARAKRLAQASGYVDGSIYDNRPDFFDDGYPLRERRPCVVYPVVRNAVASYTAMCLGDGKFPAITSGSSEDDSVIDERFGLNPEDSVIVDGSIRKIKDQTRLAAVAQQVFENELARGTSVTIASVVRGKLRVSQFDPSVCTPTFASDDPDCVTQLEIRYRYVTDDTWSESEKKFVQRVFVYRRVIDAIFDTTFAPVEITQPSQNPIPNQPAESGKFKHDFGFCPVLWRRANTDVCDQQALDGRPIHYGLYSLIDTINLSLSQRFRAALYSGDPQMVELGVLDDDALIPMGRAADAAQPTANPNGWQQAMGEGRHGGSHSEQKRKRGAGTVWRYSSPDAKVEILCLPATALQAIADDIKDNVKKIREALGHVYIDSDDLSGFGDISGKTLAFIYAQQIARCDRLREDFGRGWILPVLNMLFRIVLKCGKGLYLAGVAKLQKVLARFNAQVGSDKSATQWFAPELTMDWGAYFGASDVDEATRIGTVIAALTCELPLITYATAISSIKSIFPDIQDPAQYLKTLLAESKERADVKAAAAKAAMAANGNADDVVDGKITAPPLGSAKTPHGKSAPQKLVGDTAA